MKFVLTGRTLRNIKAARPALNFHKGQLHILRARLQVFLRVAALMTFQIKITLKRPKRNHYPVFANMNAVVRRELGYVFDLFVFIQLSDI